MNRNLTLLFSLLAIFLGVYWYFFTGNTEEVPITVSESLDQDEQRFLNLAGQLGSISFDSNLFEDTRFLSLKSLSTAILPEPQGRLDPFAPIGQ